MKINSISQQQTGFASLYTGRTITDRLAKEGHFGEFSREVRGIKSVIRKNNFHKKDNVDIILNHDGRNIPNGGFYCVISSKEQGTPMHPQYRYPISKDNTIVENFKNWIESWDNLFSKKA